MMIQPPLPAAASQARSAATFAAGSLKPSRDAAGRLPGALVGALLGEEPRAFGGGPEISALT
jgi:hypothetical protein